MIDVEREVQDPSKYDFLVIGSPIIYFKLAIRKWVKRHMSCIKDMPIIFFSVSGAPAGKKLDGWIADSFPENFIAKMSHVALRGRQIPEELTFYDRMMLKIAAMFNKDPEASKEEFEGFDFMDKNSIEPILQLVNKIQSNSE